MIKASVKISNEELSSDATKKDEEFGFATKSTWAEYESFENAMRDEFSLT